MSTRLIFSSGYDYNLIEISGTAAGCGWQKIGAYVNLGAYYVIGIPTAILLAFVYHIGGKVISCVYIYIFASFPLFFCLIFSCPLIAKKKKKGTLIKYMNVYSESDPHAGTLDGNYSSAVCARIIPFDNNSTH
jgi:hypothetical protein